MTYLVGWALRRYERKPPCSFRSLVDTQLVAAMGPPGGGRNPVSSRLLRHFNILSFTELSDERWAAGRGDKEFFDPLCGARKS